MVIQGIEFKGVSTFQYVPTMNPNILNQIKNLDSVEKAEMLDLLEEWEAAKKLSLIHI